MYPTRPKRILYGVLLFWITFCGSGSLLNPKLNLSDVLELLSYLGLLIFVANWSGIRETLGRIGYLRSGSVLGLVGMILLGQIAAQERLTYPFTTWSMFCAANPSRTYFEYIAETTSGELVPFPFKELTAFREPRQLVGAFDITASNLVSVGSSHPRFKAYQDLLYSSMSIIGSAYNRLRPNSRIVAIHVYTVSVPGINYKGRHSLKRRHLVRADVRQLPSN